MKVCVQGLWHLGTVIAGCLSSVGHEVIGLDADAAVVEALRRGQPPVLEPGLPELIDAGLRSDRLRFTDAPQDLDAIDVLWVAYDTPVSEDDVADVDFVIDQVASTLPFLRDGIIVLVSSQLPVGSIRRLEELAAARWPDTHLAFASSPENLRLGKALEVFLRPDRVIVGVRDASTRTRIGALLAPITDRIEWMSVESAEMTKHAINAFLATSVVFANEIAVLCESVGADAKEVERGLKTEQRIGPKAYLSPGAAFAGGTLARDIEFLKEIGRERRIASPLLESVRTSNDLHKGWVRGKLRDVFGDLRGVVVAVWGLTYKPGTDTLRRSLAVELGDWLLDHGATVRVHDPVVRALPPTWQERVHRCESPLEAVEGAHALVLGTEWSDYRAAAEQLRHTQMPLAVFDPNRFLAATLGGVPAIRYAAVGTPVALQA